MDHQAQAAQIIGQAGELIRLAQIGSAVAAVVPGAYSHVSLPVAAKLLVDLGALFGRHVTTEEASAILTAHTKFKPSLHVGFTLLGLVPVVGWLTSGTIASVILKEIGWATYLALSEGKDLRMLTQGEWDHYFAEANGIGRKVS